MGIGWLLGVMVYLLRWAALIALPFWVIIRGAIFAYHHWYWPSWFALLFGMCLGALVLTVYLRALLPKVYLRSRRRVFGLALLTTSLYLGFTLFDFSPKNAKTSAEHEDFFLLHPIMRVALGTVILIDPDIVVTDLSRTHADYQRMGQIALRRSLHYPQADGYVHAVDLRTKGRGFIRNQLLRLYFFLMGFNTLRHGGTADHLHISLSNPGELHVI